MRLLQDDMMKESIIGVEEEGVSPEGLGFIREKIVHLEESTIEG